MVHIVAVSEAQLPIPQVEFYIPLPGGGSVSLNTRLMHSLLYSSLFGVSELELTSYSSSV